MGVFDGGSDPVIVAYVWPSAFLLNAVALSTKILFLVASMWREAWEYSRISAEGPPPLPRL